MRHFLAPFVVFLVVAALPLGVLAQDSARAAVMRSIAPGDSVRLDAMRLGRVEGRFVASNAAILTLASHTIALEIPLDDVERLWVRGRATRKGALIGSIAGVVLGIVWGVAISEIACGPVDGGGCTAAEVAAVTGLLGAAGGAVIGFGIGFAVPTWRLRFP